jgi:hypothetical protein
MENRLENKGNKSLLDILGLLISLFTQRKKVKEKVEEKKILDNSPIKVAVIDFRPEGIEKYSEWYKTDVLVNEYIAKMNEISNGIVKYEVTKFITANELPKLEGNEQYSIKRINAVIKKEASPILRENGREAGADYINIIEKYNIDKLISSGEIDEVWMFGGPYYGFYESRMVGKGAYWCNAPAIERNCRKFVMMGFNYEREYEMMVHDYGHRTESILGKLYSNTFYNSFDTINNKYYNNPLAINPKTPFEEYIKKFGNVHYPVIKRETNGEYYVGAEYSQDEKNWTWMRGLTPEWWRLTSRVWK